MDSRVRHTRVGRTLEYAAPGLYSTFCLISWWTLEYVLPRVRGDCHTGAFGDKKALFLFCVSSIVFQFLVALYEVFSRFCSLDSLEGNSPPQLKFSHVPG